MFRWCVMFGRLLSRWLLLVVELRAARHWWQHRWRHRWRHRWWQRWRHPWISHWCRRCWRRKHGWGRECGHRHFILALHFHRSFPFFFHLIQWCVIRDAWWRRCFAYRNVRRRRWHGGGFLLDTTFFHMYPLLGQCGPINCLQIDVLICGLIWPLILIGHWIIIQSWHILWAIDWFKCGFEWIHCWQIIQCTQLWTNCNLMGKMEKNHSLFISSHIDIKFMPYSDSEKPFSKYR